MLEEDSIIDAPIDQEIQDLESRLAEKDKAIEELTELNESKESEIERIRVELAQIQENYKLLVESRNKKENNISTFESLDRSRYRI